MAGGWWRVIASLVPVTLVRFGKSNPLTCANTAATGVVWGELQNLGMVFGCCVLVLSVTGAVLSLEKLRLKED